MKDLNYYRNLLMKLDYIVWRADQCRNVKDVVEALTRFQEGTNTWMDEWVFDNIVYRKSALIRTWHSLSMNDYI